MIDKHGHLPTKAVREEYALGIVTLFPSLKDPYSKKGYVNQDFILLFDDEVSTRLLQRWDPIFRCNVIKEAKQLTSTPELRQLLHSAESQQESDEATKRSSSGWRAHTLFRMIPGEAWVLLGLLLGAESSSLWGKSAAFHRDEARGRAHARPRREASRSSPYHGPPFTSCRLPLTPAEHVVLDLNTHETGFNGDDGSYVILTWVGDDTGVILVLSTISSPLESFQEGGSSRLYRSIDYGKSFHDISQSINHTFIKEEFGVSVGPGISVILTADTPVLNNPGGIIFTSRDAGASFKLIQLPFHLAQPITYHFSNPDYLAALSIDGGLWLSLDFGAAWTKVHDGVKSFLWGAGDNLFFGCSRVDAVEAEERGDLVLKRTHDLGKTFTIIHKDVFSFGYIGVFLFFSVMEDPGSPRVMYFSSDQGQTFSQALLPSASTEQFYSILDGD
ncbi:Sortilin [Oryzias melastigma]|uniref:Sortilin n=1 Tax=Oryzias melastigma TaxID=30732 RepID=A0A834C936_ORYME|nr:Sortilin [Oryzias melastigma]